MIHFVGQDQANLKEKLRAAQSALATALAL
jgi:hypothetical protein